VDTIADGAVVVREVAISARPETVWEFLVDPRKAVRWMGVSASLDPRPGGQYRVEVIPGEVAAGEFVEIDPPRRLVHTWGWEPGSTSPSLPVRPSSSSSCCPTGTERCCGSPTAGFPTPPRPGFMRKARSPGFISIAVSDAQRSAVFYEKYLGAVRDTFDFGPDAVAFVGWPTFAVNAARGPDVPSPATSPIQLWWRASDAQSLYAKVIADDVPILQEPFDGPFGRTFAMADPDGYRVTIYEKDQPQFWPPPRS